MTLFFYGPNGYALRRQLADMLAAYKAKAESGLGVERIDGATARVRDLTATLQASPFLAASRFIVVENVASNKTLADNMESILGSVPKSTVVVFVEQAVDQRTKAFRALMQADKVVKFELLTGPKLQAWVRSQVSELGGTIEPAVTRALIERVGEDQWRLAAEVNKLVNYSPSVTVQSIEEMVSETTEQSIFNLVEQMTGGRAGDALATYRGLLQQKEPEIKILVMIQWHLRNLLLAKTSPNMTPADLAKATGMSPYVAGKILSAQSLLKEEALSEAFIGAADCELEIKSGAARADVAIEQLIRRIATSLA